ncbi:YjbQ family protein [Streptomyces sp. NPDC056084]|uniref:YjbQ family protein n=1 Tax=unclassified Streptomyces TaxID=2593676 RepID=UPI0035DE3695
MANWPWVLGNRCAWSIPTRTTLNAKCGSPSWANVGSNVHATAGIAVLETGAGSDDDLLATLHTLLPADDRWQHRHGSPGHGRDHVLPALVPPHATLPVVDGRLALGTWQSVCLVDTNKDNPNRQVRLSFLG